MIHPIVVAFCRGLALLCCIWWLSCSAKVVAPELSRVALLAANVLWLAIWARVFSGPDDGASS